MGAESFQLAEALFGGEERLVMLRLSRWGRERGRILPFFFWVCVCVCFFLFFVLFFFLAGGVFFFFYVFGLGFGLILFGRFCVCVALFGCFCLFLCLAGFWVDSCNLECFLVGLLVWFWLILLICWLLWFVYFMLLNIFDTMQRSLVWLVVCIVFGCWFLCGFGSFF